MLRILHTSDWHLGHEIQDMPREAEHEAFLSFLKGTLVEQEVDALLISGDIFDSANPPVYALRMWYRFLRDARAAMPRLNIVAIGGNHDSAARLEAPLPLLEELGVHMVGNLPRINGNFNLDRLVVKLTDKAGDEAAICVPVPFLRQADLPLSAIAQDDPSVDPLIEGVRNVYSEILTHARSVAPHLPIIAMGHLYMAGSHLSELSERRILGGNQHALPTSIFEQHPTYVALGHLHRPQAVGELDHIRYCGSPIPLSVTESSYVHQVLIVDIAPNQPAAVRSIPIPRWIDIVCLPPRGSAPLDTIKLSINKLPDAAESKLERSRWPWLTITVSLDAPKPNLRAEVESLLQGKAVRLLRCLPDYSGSNKALADSHPGHRIADLDHADILRRKWQSKYKSDVPDNVLACFAELLDQVHNQPEVVR